MNNIDTTQPLIQIENAKSWEPEGFRPVKVGDRVRVNLSSECPWWNKELVNSVGHDSCHFPDAYGLIGVIMVDMRNAAANWEAEIAAGHYWEVRLGPAFYGHYADYELELLVKEQYK